MNSTKLLSLASAGALLLASCGNGANQETTTTTDTTAKVETNTEKKEEGLKPAGPKPAWAPDIHDEMAVVIEKLASFNAPPLNTLTAEEARKQPTPTDAVMGVMKDKNIAPPASTVDTAGQDIPVPGGSVHARIYTPKGNGPFPVIVYYHGGGWVIADLNTYDASAKGLAEQTNAVVVSVHYRQAPEHKFPAAHMDSYAAYEWVLKNAASIKGDPKKVAVVGESAGGNLACNVSIMARDKKAQLPVYQVLVYPVANTDTADGSYQKYADAKPLNKPMMLWFVKNALSSPAQQKDPRIVLVNANLKGLPPTTLITAEIDPLHDEGSLLADKLKDAGVTVNYKNYNGVTHEFFGMAAVLPEAKDAQALASDDLKKAFSK